MGREKEKEEEKAKPWIRIHPNNHTKHIPVILTPLPA